jgi:hypothetical protein
MTLWALDPPTGRLPFMPSRIQGPAPDGMKLKLFSANPQHVDAQDVTII